MKVNIKKLNPNAIIPTRGSVGAAGFDLYANISEPAMIKAGETVKIPTGIAMEIPKGYVGLIFARSSLGIKRGLSPANKVGVIDEDYRGEIIVALHNDVNINWTVFEANISKTEIIERNERIAQIVFVPYLQVNFNEVDELDNTERGENGFGSSGK